MTRPTISHRIEFDRAIMDRYNAMYPAKTLWSTMNELLKHFVEISEKDSPQSKMLKAAESTKG